MAGRAAAVATDKADSLQGANHPYSVYLVTDDVFDQGEIGAATAAAIEGGVTTVQLRLKHASTRRLIGGQGCAAAGWLAGWLAGCWPATLTAVWRGVRTAELGQELQPICAEAGVPFIVDDRVDVALALGADGVHIGQTDMPPALARQLLGPDKILGVRRRTVAQRPHQYGGDQVVGGWARWYRLAAV
jgi:thiamine-phosphate pyrophosphorylase